MRARQPAAWLATFLAVSLATTACSSSPAAEDAPAEPGTDASAATGAATKVSMWTHSAGNPAEMEKIEKWIAAFNEANPEYEIALEAFPQGAYNDAVVGAAVSNSLPCILDIDGPNVPNWAYSGYLRALEIDPALLEDVNPTTVGTWGDEIYAVGQFDAAVAMLARQSDLDELGLRVPTLEEPWTGEEFQEVLDTYKDSGKFEYAVDFGPAWTGEWFPYAFSPFLQSFGGDLIDRSDYSTSEGVLNGDEAVAWGQWWQSMFAEGYSTPMSQDGADRDTGFVDGRYGLQWNGIWAANAAIEELGDDALFLPAPDFGNGPRIGAGSWQWGVSSACETPEAGEAWIEYLLQPEQVAEIADAQNTIPNSERARALTEKFAEGGPLAPFYPLTEQALIRPATPAYPTIAKVFEKAAADIANGADVERTLDAAVDQIEADLQANNGYSS